MRIMLAGLFAALTGWSAETSETRPAVSSRRNGAEPVPAENRTWKHYKGNELNFEFFGMGTLGRSSDSHIATDDIERDGYFGPGVGISYFLHRNFGVQGEVYSDGSRGGNFVDAFGGHLVGRFPAGERGLAPYVFAGLGRQLDPGIQWTRDAGVGFEWRFHSHAGLFLDVRFVWAEESAEYGLGRAGLRVGF